MGGESANRASASMAIAVARNSLSVVMGGDSTMVYVCPGEDWTVMVVFVTSRSKGDWQADAGTEA